MPHRHPPFTKSRLLLGGTRKAAVRVEQGDTVISIPARSKPLLPYVAAASLLTGALWGGLLGFLHAIDALHTVPQAAGPLPLVGLVGWPLGVLAAVVVALRLLRRSTPETLRLQPDGVAYDSGVRAALAATGATGPLERLFPRRSIVFLHSGRLRSLALEDKGTGCALTVSARGRPLVIGAALNDADRERLYQLLVKRYDLAHM